MLRDLSVYMANKKPKNDDRCFATLSANYKFKCLTASRVNYRVKRFAALSANCDGGEYSDKNRQNQENRTN